MGSAVWKEAGLEAGLEVRAELRAETGLESVEGRREGLLWLRGGWGEGIAVDAWRLGSGRVERLGPIATEVGEMQGGRRQEGGDEEGRCRRGCGDEDVTCGRALIIVCRRLMMHTSRRALLGLLDTQRSPLRR